MRQSDKHIAESSPFLTRDSFLQALQVAFFYLPWLFAFQVFAFDKDFHACACSLIRKDEVVALPLLLYVDSVCRNKN